MDIPLNRPPLNGKQVAVLTQDALNYLPRSRVIEFPKGFVLYEPGRPPEQLSLVLGGRVKLSAVGEDGSSIVLRIAGPEEFLGESALIPPLDSPRESGTVLECAQLMNWTAEELSHHIENEPRLGAALFRYFGSCNRRVLARLAAQAAYRCSDRVMLSLVELARQLGTPQPDGSLRVCGLTHQTIAEFVCTSREIVTAEMNRLRREGFLTYSRRFTDVFADNLAEHLRTQGIPASPSASLRVAM